MARIPEYIVDEILQTARIEEVIGDFVQLKRAGSNLKGLSPFTEERTPSFMVSPAKQIFKCFSTGKGGNAASFLMEVEHFSYPEALKWLANKYGIDLPEEKPPTPEEIADSNERDALFIVNEFAQKHFVSTMLNDEMGRAIGLSYFEDRGFSMETIQKFQLGYCLETGSDLTDAAIKGGYKLDYLEKSGLAKRNERGAFDFFRGRVMFPIHSISGRVLGFGGRTLKADKNIAKYFNSPESIIYNKSKILYGIHFAKNAIVKYDNCFLVEGYTDVISLHQKGVENVVASSGTSLTEDQIRLIKRYSDNITILYDGDAAGIKASFRGINMILAAGLNVKVVLFPDGDDPDSYARKVNTETLVAYIDENARDFISFKSHVLLEESGNDPIKKANLVKGILGSIAVIPDAISRTLFLKECALMFAIDEHILTGELNKMRIEIIRKEHGQEQEPRGTIAIERNKTTKDQSLTAHHSEKRKNLLKAAEYELMRNMIKFGQNLVEVTQISEDGEAKKVETSVIEWIIHELEKDEISLTDSVLLAIFNKFKEGIANSTLYSPKYFLNSQDPNIVELVADVESQEYIISENWYQRYRIDVKTEEYKLDKGILHAIYYLKYYHVEDEISYIDQSLLDLDQNDELVEDQMSTLLHKKQEFLKVKRTLEEALGRT